MPPWPPEWTSTRSRPNDRHKPYVLVVGTGNTSRGPMAAELLKWALGPSLDVRSVGTRTEQGAPAANHAIELFPLLQGHHARQLQKPDAEGASAIVAMDVAAFAGVRSAPGATSVNLEVSDPHGGDFARYTACRDELETKITAIAEGIRVQFDPRPGMLPWTRGRGTGIVIVELDVNDNPVNEYAYAFARTPEGEREVWAHDVIVRHGLKHASFHQFYTESDGLTGAATNFTEDVLAWLERRRPDLRCGPTFASDEWQFE